MAFYKSKYTGTEIDQRLTQATYDDAVLAGFEGSKEEFDAILGKLKEIADKAENSIQTESENLDTFNKNVVDAINELHRELQAKPDEQDVIDQGELEVFKDEIAAKYATREELEGDIQDANSKISTLNNNLVESINTINKNVTDSLTIVNQAIQQNAETLVAEIEQRKEADTELDSKIIQEISDRQTADDQLSERIKTLENAGYQNADQVKAEIEKLVDAAPETLDTLKEIGDALNNDPDFAATMTNELSKKVDWVDYNNTKNIVLPSNGQVFGDFGGEESNSSLLGARIYNAGLENEEKQVEVGTVKVHLNLNSLDKPTIETPDGKESLVVESDIESMPIEVNFPIRTSGGSDGPEDRIYTQDEILKWFGVTDIAALKTQIANKGIQYIKYGIMLMGNPYYYKMPIEYCAFESANQIKLVFTGLNTNNDVVSKYEILANLNGDLLTENSNVKLTITSIESEDVDLSEYVTKEELNDYALKSEIPDVSSFVTKEEVPSVFETKGLTELEMGESSANIEAALGIDFISLIEIIRENKTIIVDRNSAGDYKSCIHATGNISSGNGAANLMFFIGTTPTIYQIQYVNGTFALAVDEYEFAMKSELPDTSNLATVATSGNYNDLTNTPNLTVYQTISDDSLTTSAKTIPAAINEVKNSVDQIQAPYEINLTNLLAAEDSESISTAIGGIDNLNATVQDNRIIVGTISNGSVSVSIRILGNVTTLYYLLDSVVGLTLNEVSITNTSGTLSKNVTTHSVLTENIVINSLDLDETTLPLSAAQGKVLNSDKQNKTDETLQTTDKTIVGAINELLAKVQELETKNTELESRLAALEGTN